MRNYYMVRAQGSKEEDFKEFFDKNIIAVGWSNIDFSKENNINNLKGLNIWQTFCYFIYV